MRFLVDNALSPTVARELSAAGHDAIHVRDLAMAASPDESIFDHAAKDDRVVVTADTDFGTLLALRGGTKPSVIQFRGNMPDEPADQAALMVANLPTIVDDLNHGAIVTIRPARIRIRRLPMI